MVSLKPYGRMLEILSNLSCGDLDGRDSKRLLVWRDVAWCRQKRVFAAESGSSGYKRGSWITKYGV